VKSGFFRRQRTRSLIQRYQCARCHHSFSDQTNSLTYRQKRPDLLESVITDIGTGLGIRRIAAKYEVSVTTVQRKVLMLAAICEAFQEKHMKNWKSKPRFQFDEMWSSVHARANSLTLPVVVEVDSYFIVSARATHSHSLLSIPSKKIKNNTARALEIAKRHAVTTNALSRCSRMKPHGRIVVETDGDSTYNKILSGVFGPRLVHIPYNVKLPGNQKKLFPVDNTMACMRAEQAMCRRESWYLTKKVEWLNCHLAIYTVFHNFIRLKRYTLTRKVYFVSKPDSDKVKKKVNKTFEKKTPAEKLGIFNEPLTFKYILKHCGISLSARGKPQTLLPPFIATSSSPRAAVI
jgi:transposase-like protein